MKRINWNVDQDSLIKSLVGRGNHRAIDRIDRQSISNSSHSCADAHFFSRSSHPRRLSRMIQLHYYGRAIRNRSQIRERETVKRASRKFLEYRFFDVLVKREFTTRP